MFTNGVVASVKIYRGDDDTAPRLRLPCRRAGRTRRLTVEQADEAGSDRTWNTDGGVAVDGPAPQEGFET